MSSDSGGDCWGCVGKAELDAGWDPSGRFVRIEIDQGWRGPDGTAKAQDSLLKQSTSIGADAARHFLAVTWAREVPNDEALLEAIDQLLLAYHNTPEGRPSGDLDAPNFDEVALYEEASCRFPNYAHYPVSDPMGQLGDATMLGDPIDDLADITSDMREVVRLADQHSLEDAHWYFRLHYPHWGRHARELSLYLHARQS